ncbi:MAG: bifunctional molybdenum cofactor biosynthesis protein MoaC/MoaB [Desulfobacterales bacterium]|nr:bifunctional molybdenum cofactor biosynthesis protein MoaC/MoaB [Desulfobacterales bacterium]
MKSVSDKIETLRTAVAVSTLRTTPDAIARLKTNDLPKKDALVVARIAGISAAKKTSDLIPYCHPIPIDVVEINFEILPEKIIITSTVESIAKTGVEMEALTGASIAALTLYDMLKPLDQEMEIVSTKLFSKKGGKSSHKEWVPQGFQAAVIVTSDGTFEGKREDKSGQIIKERLEAYGITPSYMILPDDKDAICAKLKELCLQGIALIFTTGGTGLGPRDVTVEAAREIMDRDVPGIMEAARAYGQRRTPYAMLSRGLAAQKGKTLILNLPGSSNGVRETLNAIFPGVLHAYGMMEGAGH